MTTNLPDFPSSVKNQNFPFSLHNNTDKVQIQTQQQPQKFEEEEEEIEIEKRRRTMFYSQCFLSNKGPLSAIWIAGYFFKRLKKRQITDTDISSSVDKILLEGLPSVTYRILAYLLLGVVRIYSKKVEFLFEDCHEIVSNINKFSVGKEVIPFRDIVRSCHSIILPKRYELDSFQLDVADSARGNTARNEDISLCTLRGKGVFSQYSLDKQRFEEVSDAWEDFFDAQTSHGFTTQQATCSSTQTPHKTAVERETLTFAHTPPDIVMSPQHLENDVEVSSPGNKNFEKSKEKLRELRFTQEEGINADRMCETQKEGIDADRFCELDVELINLINDYREQTAEKRDEDGLKQELLRNECDLSNVKEMPTLAEKTHDLEVPDAQAATAPEIMVVPTPPKKENFQRHRKRKCVFDVMTVLDNATMKQALKDTSGLVCKRRKAPHTVIDLWRFDRIPSPSKIFMDPLIPCVAFEPEYIHCKKKTGKIEPSTSQAVEPIETTQAPQKQRDAVTPSAPADSSRSTIAPGTPVQCPASARVFASARAADSDGEGVQYVHAHDNFKEFSVHEEENSGPNLMAEMDANEGDSQEVHKSKNGELSARTRTVARYLRQVIQGKKQRRVEATLLPIVERKTKRENAMLFFEILVLSSGGFINVVQEKAYGDVLLRETPQLEETLKKC